MESGVANLIVKGVGTCKRVSASGNDQSCPYLAVVMLVPLLVEQILLQQSTTTNHNRLCQTW